jgi:predicted Zn-dependent protease
MNRSQPSVPSISSIAAHRRDQIFRLLSAIAVVGSAMIAPGARAYVFEPGNPRWTQSSVTFVLSLGSSRTLSDGTTYDQSGVAALQTWNQYMQSLQLNPVTNDSTPVGQNDGVNSIAFSSSFFGQSFGSNTLAITGYSYFSGQMSEANTLVNTRWTWDSYRGPLRSAMDIRRVLIHEIGHALGLDHPDQAGQHVAAIMNSLVSDIDTAVTDDINGIQAIYGARSSSSTPTPTPTATPQPTATPTPTATPSLRSASISAAPTFIHTGQSAIFTISLSSSSSSPVTINYVAGGSARQSLYTLSGIPRQVTIPAGSTSANVTLTVIGRPRRAKTVTLFLATGSNYSLSAVRQATVTISR